MTKDPLVTPRHYADCNSPRPRRLSPVRQRPRYYIEVYRAEREFAVTCSLCFRTTCYRADESGQLAEIDGFAYLRPPDWEEVQ